MNPHNTLGTVAAILIVVFAGGDSSYGQAVTPSTSANSTGNWLQNWNNGTASEGGFTQVPTTGDGNAIINQNRTIQVDSIVTTVAPTVIVNNTNNSAGSATAFLEVNTGGSLSAGSMIVSNGTDSGTLTVQGGDLSVTGALTTKDNGTTDVTSGTIAAASAVIAGGTAGVGAAGNGGVVNVGGGTVSVTGSTAINTAADGGGVLNVTSGTYNGAAFTVNGTVNVSGTGAVTASGISTVGGTGTYNVDGGTLTASNDIRVDAGGVFNASGGDITVAVLSGPALDLNGGDFNVSAGTVELIDHSLGGGTFDVTTAGNTGSLTISGGTFRVLGTSPTDTIQFRNDVVNISGGVVDLSGGQVIANSNVQFNILGDDATITMDRLNLGPASRAATLNFVLDDTGVSTIQNNAFLSLASASLIVDGAAYTGGIGSYDLIASGNLASAFDVANITVTGLGVEGVDYEIVQGLTSAGGDGDVTLNILTSAVAVPEPSSIVVLGLAATCVLTRRRR